MTSVVDNGLFWKRRCQKSSRKVEICEVLDGTFATNFVYVFSLSTVIAPPLPGLNLMLL